jgi:CHAD domain-containing protein
LRKTLGSRTYREENASFRDAARPLTELRDAQVLVDALDKLTNQFSSALDPRAVGIIRRALKEHRRSVRQQMLEEKDSLGPVRKSLEAAQNRLNNWPLGRRGWSVLGAGLKRVYRNARDAFTQAQNNPSVENLHEWRKQSKYLWHELQMLQPLWPAVLDELADQVHELTNQLGEDHDLAVLRQKLQEDVAKNADQTTIQTLVKLIERRRAELEEQAALLGGRLYEEKPSQFVRRLAGYWHLWRIEGRGAGENAPAALTSSRSS